MRWNEKIYTDPQIENVKTVIEYLKSPRIKKTRKRTKTDDRERMYCVCISKKTPFVLEIIRYTELAKKIYDSYEYTVIGLAAKKSAAIMLVAYIVNKSLRDETDYKNIKDNIYAGELFLS